MSGGEPIDKLAVYVVVNYYKTTFEKSKMPEMVINIE